MNEYLVMLNGTAIDLYEVQCRAGSRHFLSAEHGTARNINGGAGRV